MSKNSETAKLRIQERSREIGNKRKRTTEYLKSTEENLQIVNECTTPKASPPHTHPQKKIKLSQRNNSTFISAKLQARGKQEKEENLQLQSECTTPAPPTPCPNYPKEQNKVRIFLKNETMSATVPVRGEEGGGRL